MRASRRQWLLGAVIVLLVVAAYVPALQSGYIWDDDVYVTNNPSLRSAEGLWSSWTHLNANVQYYPLVFTSFWLEYHLWQLAPAGYHAVNVALHLLNALLVWRILRQLGVPGGWLAAAVFALHPVHVESVAWITERKNVLSGFFYLGAMWTYLRFDDARRSTSSLGAGRTWSNVWALYALAALLFCCALLSKTVTAMLPVALLVIAWWKRGSLGKRDVMPLVPFLLVGAVMGSLTAWVERVQVGALGGDWDLSLIERFLVAGRAIWFYVGKLVLPANLTFSYPRWSIDAGTWWQFLLPASVIAATAVLYVTRDRIGRGPFAAAVFFIATLVPALGFFDVYPMRYSFVADHFQYLASLGPIVVVSSMLATAANRFTRADVRFSARARRLMALALVSPLLVTLAGLTWKQSSIYRNEETLWFDTIAKNPGSWMAYNNLGLYYFRQGEWGLALPRFRQSVTINPDNAEAHYNLALVLQGIGRDAEAESHFDTASRLRPGIGRNRGPESRSPP
jgi:hypothetical protein